MAKKSKASPSELKCPDPIYGRGSAGQERSVTLSFDLNASNPYSGRSGEQTGQADASGQGGG